MSRFPEPGDRYNLIPDSEDLADEVGILTGKHAVAPKRSDPPKKSGARYKQVRPPTPQERLAQVAQYVPAEVLAGYISLCSVFAMIKAPDEHTLRFWLFVAAFVVGLIFTPLYAGKMTQDERFRRTNQMMATLAFIVWSYCYPVGLAKELHYYIEPIAALVMVVFSLISGLINPKPSMGT